MKKKKNFLQSQLSDIVSECLVDVWKCTQFCESFDIRRSHTHSKTHKALPVYETMTNDCTQE